MKMLVPVYWVRAVNIIMVIVPRKNLGPNKDCKNLSFFVFCFWTYSFKFSIILVRSSLLWYIFSIKLKDDWKSFLLKEYIIGSCLMHLTNKTTIKTLIKTGNTKINLQKESLTFYWIIKLLSWSSIEDIKSGDGRAFPKVISSINPT
jgi:hypothetical protein